MRRYGRVVLGGTFDRLHAGHEALLRTAFQLGRTVAIGLTSPTFLSDHPKPRGRGIRSWPSRRAALARWIRRNYGSRGWTIVPIDDRFGGAAEGDVDALVVSADTVAGGRALNRERARRGYRPAALIVVPLVLADDLEPLSSRRIRAGEVDPAGRLTRSVTLGLAVADPEDAPAALRGVLRAFPRVRVRRPRPVGRASRAPAALRRLAARAQRGADLGVAVARRPRGGWSVVVQGRHAGLDPRAIQGRSGRALEQGLLHLLRPPGPARPGG